MSDHPVDPEEVAAVLAVLTVLEDERRLTLAVPGETAGRGDDLDAWVRASRLSGRRSGLSRGPWRLSGRISRRCRA